MTGVVPFVMLQEYILIFQRFLSYYFASFGISRWNLIFMLRNFWCTTVEFGLRVLILHFIEMHHETFSFQIFVRRNIAIWIVFLVKFQYIQKSYVEFIGISWKFLIFPILNINGRYPLKYSNMYLWISCL